MPFVLLAIAIAWAHYRKGLPFAIRSVFYPLLGERINEWMGDVIDVTAVLATFMGTSVVLGFGVIMFTSGNLIHWKNLFGSS